MSRDAFALAARSLVGLTEPSPELAALVDPAGDPAHQGQVERLSLCMLTYRGLLCRVLAIDPALAEVDRPYVPGSIPRILGAILDEAGAKRVPTLDSPPGPGDGIWYAANGAHPEHVDACVLDTSDPDHGEYIVVAGGQRNMQGHETILLVARSLRWNGSAWVCQATGRPVRWVLDADALESRYGLSDDLPATLPAGTPAAT